MHNNLSNTVYCCIQSLQGDGQWTRLFTWSTTLNLFDFIVISSTGTCQIMVLFACRYSCLCHTQIFALTKCGLITSGKCVYVLRYLSLACKRILVLSIIAGHLTPTDSTLSYKKVIFDHIFLDMLYTIWGWRANIFYVLLYPSQRAWRDRLMAFFILSLPQWRWCDW